MKIRPLSRREFNNNIHIDKINKRMNKSRNNFSSFMRRNNYSIQNFYQTKVINHNEKPKLFSLLDINDKITNSKGPSIPAQYRRLTDIENQRLFGFSYKLDKTLDINGIKRKLNNDHIKKMINNEDEKNMENNIKFKSIFDDNLKSEENNCFNKKAKIRGYNELNNKRNEINKMNNNNYNKNNEISIENSNKNDQKFSLKKNPIKLIKSVSLKNYDELRKSNNNDIIKRDRWLPKGYDSYELLVKHPKLFNKKLKMEYTIKKSISAKLLKDKAYKSDIFFFKPPTEKEVAFKSLDRYRDYQNSDIFNIKNDSQNLSKSGEKFLFKETAKRKYNVSRESNSQWKPTDMNIPTLTNYPSKDYNILNPSNKGTSLTKEKVMIFCENKKDKNSNMINNVNYMNPIYRQKGIAEYIDITRNGASNTGKDYINSYNDNKNCFFKRDDICSSLYNTYYQYQNICKKPFVKSFFD